MFCEVSYSSSDSVGTARPLTLYTAHRQVMAQLAGDGTITDSAAQIVTRSTLRLEGTRPRGEIGFWCFLHVGAVFTTLDLVLAILSPERAVGRCSCWAG